MNTPAIVPSSALALRPVALKEEDGIKFWDNGHPRAPTAIICDTSSSMAGAPLAELQRGLEQFFDAIAKDELASLRVDSLVVRCGEPVETLVPFGAAEPGEKPVLPVLTAAGRTPLGLAVRHAIAEVQARRAEYRRCALGSFRPMVLVLSDGEPNDEGWEVAADELRALAERGWNVIGVGIGEAASLDTLQRFCVQPVRRLGATDLAALFKWLSDSQRALSRSQSTGALGCGLPAELPEVPRL